MELRREDWNKLVAAVQELNSMQPLIMSELKRLNTCYQSLHSKVGSIDKTVSVDIAKLKIKATAWGVLGGAIPATVAIATAVALWLIKKP